MNRHTKVVGFCTGLSLCKSKLCPPTRWMSEEQVYINRVNHMHVYNDVNVGACMFISTTWSIDVIYPNSIITRTCSTLLHYCIYIRKWCQYKVLNFTGKKIIKYTKKTKRSNNYGWKQGGRTTHYCSRMWPHAAEHSILRFGIDNTSLLWLVSPASFSITSDPTPQANQCMHACHHDGLSIIP